MKNMRKQLRLTLPKTSLTALNEAERASGQVWRIERTAVPVYRLLRDLEPDLQRDSLLNFAEACDADETIDSKSMFNAKQEVSTYQMETFDGKYNIKKRRRACIVYMESTCS